MPLWPSAAGKRRWPGRPRLRRGLRGCGGGSRWRGCAWTQSQRPPNVELGRSSSRGHPGRCQAHLPRESRRRRWTKSRLRTPGAGGSEQPSSPQGCQRGGGGGRRCRAREEGRPGWSEERRLSRYYRLPGWWGGRRRGAGGQGHSLGPRTSPFSV